MQEKETERTTSETLVLIFKWRKLIAGISLLSFVLALIFTSAGFMPPIYKSEAVIYPPATYSTKVLAEFDLRLGSDKDIDEHIQMLKSGILRDSIIRKFELMKHYEIDSSSSSKLTELYSKYEENIKIDRTRYNSILIQVYDTDPKIAAAIANAMVETGDEVKEFIIKQNLRNAYSSVKKEFFDKAKEINQLREELKTKSEILIAEPEGIGSSTGFLSNAQADISRALEKNGNVGLTAELLYTLKDHVSQLDQLRESLKLASAKMNNKITSSYIVTPPSVPDRKSKPDRALIILAVLVASMLITVLSITAFERLRSIKIE